MECTADHSHQKSHFLAQQKFKLMIGHKIWTTNKHTLQLSTISSTPPLYMYSSNISRLTFTHCASQYREQKITLISQKGQRLSLISQMSLLLIIKQIAKRTQILSETMTDKHHNCQLAANPEKHRISSLLQVWLSSLKMAQIPS